MPWPTLLPCISLPVVLAVGDDHKRLEINLIVGSGVSGAGGGAGAGGSDGVVQGKKDIIISIVNICDQVVMASYIIFFHIYCSRKGRGYHNAWQNILWQNGYRLFR